MGNIVFIFGDDTFRSFEYLRALRNRYIDKALGDINLSVMEGGEIKEVSQLSRAFGALPFLAPKRLVVIRDLVRDNSQIASPTADLLEKIPVSSVVVFFERGAPDQRSRLVKALKKQAIVKEFKQLQPFQLKEWIRKKLAQTGKTIEPPALDLLLQRKGQNSGAIFQEIAKLSLVKDSRISVRQVKQLVNPIFSDRIYQLTDLFLSSSRQSELLRRLDRLRKGGGNELMIFFALVNFFRSMLLAVQYPNRNVRQLMADLGLRYYPALRLSQAHLPPSDKVKIFYRQLLNYDCQIKTGKIEAGLALDLIVCQWLDLVKGNLSRSGYAVNFN